MFDHLSLTSRPRGRTPISTSRRSPPAGSAPQRPRAAKAWTPVTNRSMASSTCVSVLAVGDRFGVGDQRRVLVRRQGRESDLLAATAGVALLISGTAHVDPVSGDHGDGRAEGVRREVAGGLCTEPERRPGSAGPSRTERGRRGARGAGRAPARPAVGVGASLRPRPVRRRHINRGDPDASTGPLIKISGKLRRVRRRIARRTWRFNGAADRDQRKAEARKAQNSPADLALQRGR